MSFNTAPRHVKPEGADETSLSSAPSGKESGGKAVRRTCGRGPRLRVSEGVMGTFTAKMDLWCLLRGQASHTPSEGVEK